jgi:hypothetical protein
MSIITFWNSGREQVGKTLAIASIVTQYSMLHNKKVLIISTSFNDDTLKRCFWGEEKAKKKTGFFDRKPTVGIENGIDGLVKIMNSNKIMPNIITDYTKIVFKDRLEILPGYVGEEQGYKEIQENYEQVNTLNKNEILRKSDVILYAMSQRMKSINDYNDVLDDFDDTLDSKKVLPILCRYDKKSKYTAKNISRFLGQKNNMLTVPYNTLFFEATEEGKLVDFLLRIRNVDENDKNAFFLSEIKRASETIIYKVEELQMR